MYQINVVTYSTDVNKKNALRKIVNRQKRILGGRFESVKLARKALKEFFEKDCYQIGNEIKEKGSETYVKTLSFGNIMLEMEYKIIKCN